jgi:hypothetical protein
VVALSKTPEQIAEGSRPFGLAAEDLRDALLADLQHSGDRVLGEAATECGADFGVAFGAQLLTFFVQFRLALCVVPGERR